MEFLCRTGLVGSGLGDGWQFGFLGVVVINLALVATGLALRPRFWAHTEQRTR